MSATPLEVKEDELARGRAEVAPEVSTEVGDDAGGGGPQGPPPPARKTGGGRRGDPPPGWLRTIFRGMFLLLALAMIGIGGWIAGKAES